MSYLWGCRFHCNNIENPRYEIRDKLINKNDFSARDKAHEKNDCVYMSGSSQGKAV